MAVRILIVDDHEVVRQGVRSILQSRPNWEICGEASDGHEAVYLAKELQPDIILLDVTMPVMGGLAAASYILQSNRDAKILIFTMHESATLAKLAQKTGARGLVVKSQAGPNLIQALEKVLAGNTYFSTGDEFHHQESGKVT